MAVAEVFAHDGAVFGVELGVVVAVPGARFGEFLDEQFVEQLRDVAVDVLEAVAHVKAQDDEWEAR